MLSYQLVGRILFYIALCAQLPAEVKAVLNKWAYKIMQVLDSECAQAEKTAGKGSEQSKAKNRTANAFWLVPATLTPRCGFEDYMATMKRLVEEGLAPCPDHLV